MAKRIFLDITDEKSGVTGTCQLLDVHFPKKVYSGKSIYTNNIPFMLDCGTFQGEDNSEELNKSFHLNMKSPEFAILTHGHLDHYGRFPLAIKKGFYAPIFTTYITKTFIDKVFLDDCLNIEKKKSKKLDLPMLYAESEANQFRSCMIGCQYNKKISYSNNISIYFFENGHVPGAAVTLIHIECLGYEEINIVCTGDYNSTNMFFKVNSLPSWVYELPNVTMITESTYGNKSIKDLRPDSFIRNIVNALESGKIVIIPTFAFGRAQEVAYTLRNAQTSGELNPKFSIYHDGKTGIDCTNLFLSDTFPMYPSCRSFLPTNHHFIEDKRMRREIFNNPSPKILYSSSGMGNYGTSKFYIDNSIDNPNALIHAVGYLSPLSKLGKLKRSTCNAEICDTDKFSAHAKKEDLIAFIRPFRNVKSILVTHGEPNVKQEFANELLEEFNVRVGILSSKSTYRITSDGIVACFL